MRDPEPALAQPRGTWVLQETSDLTDLREQLRAEMGERSRAPADSFALADPVERVLLVSTELGGNGLRHAAAPVTLRLLRSARGWMVKVTDAHPDRPPRPAEVTGGAAGKRGLVIVDALSSGTGWCADGGVKHVWAFVPDAPPHELVSTLRPGTP